MRLPLSVLVADDHPAVHETLSLLAAKSGKIVLLDPAFTRNGISADQEPDIVVLDVRLPNLPGGRITSMATEELEEIAGRFRPDTRILLYTAQLSLPTLSLWQAGIVSGLAYKGDSLNTLLSSIEDLGLRRVERAVTPAVRAWLERINDPRAVLRDIEDDLIHLPEVSWPADVQELLIYLNAHVWSEHCTISSAIRSTRSGRGVPGRFRRYVGKYPKEYLQMIRVRALVDLRNQCGLSISEAAAWAGYASESAGRKALSRSLDQNS
ncbi:MAG: hypothetical protein JJ896_02460 [Rhodothermales bacterium]|nr:hypothetical protein [Rhodothermales bacterium]MBO6778493.1 hypothetical protein [Rhodothermales bacterium]